MLKKLLYNTAVKLKLIRGNRLAHSAQIHGWLTDEEVRGLFEIAKQLPLNASVIEIGTWKGKSTWCIAEGLRKGNIHCIDPFNADGEAASKNDYEDKKGILPLADQFRTNMTGIKKTVTITTHEGYSNAFTDLDVRVDLLFIDGDHSIDGCRFDFENYAPKIKPKGFLAFHDYLPERTELGPTWVIDNLVKTNAQYILYRKYDSLCIFQKI